MTTEKKKRKKRDRDGNYLFGVCGGSCSGKTTFVNALAKVLGEENCSLFSQDNFYFEDFKKAIKPADKPKPVQASRVKQWKDVQIDYCVVPVSDFAPAPQSNMPIYIAGTTTIS